MRNQGCALNRARRKSRRCRPSLQRGWWSDDTGVCFLPFVWVCEDGGECNFEPNEICIRWLCPCSHYCAAVCLIQFVCELSPYYQMCPKLIFSYWAFSHDQKPPRHQSVLITTLLVIFLRPARGNIHRCYFKKVTCELTRQRKAQYSDKKWSKIPVAEQLCLLAPK